jgi:hypothetical protein
MGRSEDLIHERSLSSTFYQKLSPERQALFEQTLKTIVDMAIENSALPLIRVKGHKTVFLKTGITDFLDSNKQSLLETFNAKAISLNPALRNCTRDVLLILADCSNPNATIADLIKRRKLAQEVGPKEISPGRSYSTSEVQPPSVKTITLRRKHNENF